MKKYIILTLSVILATVGIVSLYLSTQSTKSVTQASSDVLTTRQNELQPKQLTTDITTSDESIQPEPIKEETKLETGSSQLASGSSEPSNSKTPVVTLPPVKQQPKPQPKKTTPKPKVTELVDSEDVSGTSVLYLESFDEEGFIYSNPDTGNSQYFYYDQFVAYHIDNINIGSEITVTYDEDGDVVKVNGKKVTN